MTQEAKGLDQALRLSLTSEQQQKAIKYTAKHGHPIDYFTLINE